MKHIHLDGVDLDLTRVKSILLLNCLIAPAGLTFTDSDLTRLSPIPEYVLNDERKGAGHSVVDSVYRVDGWDPIWRNNPIQSSMWRVTEIRPSWKMWNSCSDNVMRLPDAGIPISGPRCVPEIESRAAAR